MHFSKSSIATIRSCPFKFKLKHLDRLKEPATMFTHYAEHGTEVHKEIENFFNKYKLEGNEIDSTDFISCTDDFHSFIEYQNKRLQKLKDKSTFYPVTQEIKVEANIHGIRLVGFFDALFLTDNGEGYNIVDWKTGKEKPGNEIKHEMAFYHMLVKANREVFTKPIRKWSMFFTQTGKMYEFEPEQSYLDKAVDKMKQAKALVDSGKFEPKSGMHCNWCGYALDNCEVYE